MTEIYKDVKHYIWTGDDLLASLTTDVQTSKEGKENIRANIGNITIKKNDIISIEHGSSVQVYTRSGKGYESQYPFGKVVLYGVGASVVLDSTNNMNTSLVISAKSLFEEKVKAQQLRVEPEIASLKAQYIVEHNERIRIAKEQKIINDAANKIKVANALEKMEAAFGSPAKKKKTI